jgi:FKBP-type peptidyl-prolyl cis-trans isomerase 2
MPARADAAEEPASEPGFYRRPAKGAPDPAGEPQEVGMRTVFSGLVCFGAVLALAALYVSPGRAEKEGSIPMVEDGKQISIEYTLTLDDGTTADSNVGGEPLIFQQGAHQILPSLESELTGMKIDDSKQVVLSPEQGYGTVDPDAFRTVEMDAVPAEAREAGAVLIAQDPGGNRRPVRVHEVKGGEIVLDFNHPLAGQNLNFDVRILAIE